jgi:SAM-dependent methyltransferase
MMTTSRTWSEVLPDFLCCPDCRSVLAVDGDCVRCPEGHTFPVAEGVIDFLKVDGVGGEVAPHLVDQETSGMYKRVDNYVLPWLREFGGRVVLDDGCGVGHTVEYLHEQGIEAYGIDPGPRQKYWPAQTSRLFRASGTKLPFADESFDAVLSSGVIEHIGEPLARRQQHPHQRAYIHEVIRVLRPGGRALIAAPNGAFPIDFWHGTVGRVRIPLRPHVPYEAWMPNGPEVAGWVRSAPVDSEVRYLPPLGYLAFDNVRTHWYGRVFGGLMMSVFRLIDRYPRLSASPLNPWLIVEIRRS